MRESRGRHIFGFPVWLSPRAPQVSIPEHYQSKIDRATGKCANENLDFALPSGFAKQ